MMAGQVILFGAVRGLAAEGTKAKMLISEHKPDLVGLSISKESIAAMKELFNSDAELPEPANFEEEMYIEGLGHYGEVIRPPPCFSEAWKAAESAGIAVKALDMDEEHFTSAYCKYVSTLEMVRQGRCEKKWARHGFVAQSAEEFVIEWDQVINWLPGYQKLEAAREQWIAKAICVAANSGKNILAIVELERLAGVKKALDEAGCEYVEPGQ